MITSADVFGYDPELRWLEEATGSDTTKENKMIVSRTDGTKPNIDVGRTLQFADILDDITFPIGRDDGDVYCYLCQRNHRLEVLTPLTPSSGVFTAAVTCDNDSPVYLCLEHIPHLGDQFESFTPEVQALLRVALRHKQSI